MKRVIALLLLAAMLPACETPREQFERRIDRILEPCEATVGVAVLAPDGTPITRNDRPLPMLSVFKFPVALAVLDRTVREGIPLSTPVAVGPEWLDSGTYSPMRDSLPPQGGTLPLGRLLAYAVSQSDNIACDRLIDFAGGPGAVDGYLKRLGITEIRITATERTMHLATENQRINTARPSALCSLFDRFLQGELLPQRETAWLRVLLEGCATGQNKLRAGLPPEVRLGHKTGSSDCTPEGIRIADNDAGYVVLPDGRHYCITVLVTDSRHDDARNAGIIAAISEAAYEYFTNTRHKNGRP